MKTNSPMPTEIDEALASLTCGLVTPLGREGMSVVSAGDLPDGYRQLLDHEAHMTTTLADFHARPVELEVIENLRETLFYTRLIRLSVAETNHVAEVGVMRFNLEYASEAVRDAVIQAQTPLGEILISHDVLRRIEPLWFVRVDQPSPFLPFFDAAAPEPAYGRIGRIFCDGKPAIDLLEIVTDKRPPAAK